MVEKSKRSKSDIYYIEKPAEEKTLEIKIGHLLHAENRG